MTNKDWKMVLFISLICLAILGLVFRSEIGYSIVNNEHNLKLPITWGLDHIPKVRDELIGISRLLAMVCFLRFVCSMIIGLFEKDKKRISKSWRNMFMTIFSLIFGVYFYIYIPILLEVAAFYALGKVLNNMFDFKTQLKKGLEKIVEVDQKVYSSHK